MAIQKDELILDIKNLDISFQTSSGEVKAVRGVNIDLYKGETIAIVGESGSGKSVTVKAIMGILASNGRINSGEINYLYETDGKRQTVDLLRMNKKEIRQKINGKQIAMIFQDPMTSLDPTMTVGRQIMEGMRYHYRTKKAEAYQKALHLLDLVGITNPEERMKNYPHELSGGMRQRVVIAIALACDPDVLICDEPTTALDVTIQAKILELISDIQKKSGISVIYITHDLGVVAKVADYVSVMYAGRIVERGTVSEVFYDPKHPYTWGLLAAMPDLDTEAGELMPIPGNPPNMARAFDGDPFMPRNRYALKIDLRLEAPLFRVSRHHYVASWLMHDEAPKLRMPSTLDERIKRMKREGEAYAE